MPRGLYRDGADRVMVLYDHNSMLMANENYVARNYLPDIDKLPTHAQWVAWHQANGSESQTHAEWLEWRSRSAPL
ncbi:hypothetical protein [Aminobacter sp. MET-1]|uniref:hypothetical protein n=1 Tax=Aminobacter sp. MET-1 TaxID=2951085 RepID=UPI002269F51F|nr:hypothetical protein [Aminobacter sp. MET-1]MCX8568342.1 hypothetical protein [Aminobacter sp. MET-1]